MLLRRLNSVRLRIQEGVRKESRSVCCCHVSYVQVSHRSRSDRSQIESALYVSRASQLGSLRALGFSVDHRLWIASASVRWYVYYLVPAGRVR